MIEVKVLADSINPAGDRITTGLWTYPRFIHSEIMTHRMLAKNSASSRAIPVEKMIQAVRENPASFEQYGAANKGMQAQGNMDEETKERFIDAWCGMGAEAVMFAREWKDKAAKQLVNRVLEPWAHMTIVITGTDWHNFFALRAHPAAQPEFQVLAYRWLDAYLKSEPALLEFGEWHLPFVDTAGLDDKRMVLTSGSVLNAWKHQSVARCARVSYTRHDAEDTPNKNEALHDRLLESGHMSPFEHQAMAYANAGAYEGAFKGWKPYRKFLPNENRQNVDLHELLANKPGWITL